MGGRTVRRMNCAAFHFSTITRGKAFVVNPLVLSSSFMMRHMERLHFSTLPSLKPHVWLMVAATQSVLLSVQQTSPLTQEPDYKRERGVCVFLCVHMCRNTHRWSSNDQRFRRRERKWILRAGGGLVLRHISPTHFLRWCRTLVPPPRRKDLRSPQPSWFIGIPRKLIFIQWAFSQACDLQGFILSHCAV